MPLHSGVAALFLMQRFNCDCGNVIFFGSSRCLKCGKEVGYDPYTTEMLRIQPSMGMKRCENGVKHGVCNWLVPANSRQKLCVGCLMNRTIPDLNSGRNLLLWGRMEMAKSIGSSWGKIVAPC